jgi:dolichol-phosphate mannosyltransferase
MPTLQAIVPLFNESEGLRTFDAQLRAQGQSFPPEWSFRVLYVDDGSTDATAEILGELHSRHRDVDYVLLSRNFGHQAALWAGLEAADADAVVVMDGDGQHPVDLIPQMLRLHIGGIDVVRTRRRQDERAEGALKYWMSSQFHRLWTHLSQTAVPQGTTEFALFGRPVLRALRRHRETHRYLRGLLTLVGFSTASLLITISPREHGSSKYSLRKQMRLASDAIFSFSAAPLRLGLLLGGLFLLVAAFEGMVVIWNIVAQATLPSGWASLMVMVTLGFGSTMVLLGLLGIYIGKIFEQVKNRPVYIVRYDSHARDAGEDSGPGGA